VRGERIDGDVGQPVNGLTVSDLGTFSNNHLGGGGGPGGASSESLSCGNAIGELEWSRWFGAPGAPLRAAVQGDQPRGAQSVIVSRYLARSSSVLRSCFGEIQNCTSSRRRWRPIAAAVCLREAGLLTSAGMPSIHASRGRQS